MASNAAPDLLLLNIAKAEVSFMSTLNEQDAKRVEQARTTGEKERDNDAHRPDGSTGTEQDTTAQKTARDVPAHKP